MSRRRKKLDKPCRYPGCAHIGRGLFCRNHWFHVPRGMRVDLVATWKSDGLVAVLKKIPDAIHAIDRSLKRGTRVLAARRQRAAEVLGEGNEVSAGEG